MFTKQKSLIRLTCTGSFLTLAAACAQPPLPVPIVADMYYDKFSAVQSTGTGVDFCEMDADDFTPKLVAQIRSNPNYERNLAIWLEECPELALAFADFGTATIASPAAPSPFGGEGPPTGGGFGGGENPGNPGGPNGPGGDNNGGDDNDGDDNDGDDNGDTGGNGKGDNNNGGDDGVDKGDDDGDVKGEDNGDVKGEDNGDVKGEDNGDVKG